MKITLLGWKCSNIRGLRNLEINLRDSSDAAYPITFVMMPNGQGKTTTMDLLHATLSGSAERWSSQRVRAYRSPGSEADSGAFDLSLLVDGMSYVISLRLDYRGGTASYFTSSPATRGLESGRGLPTELLRVLSEEEFVRRFIFDGELVKDILNSSKRDAEEALRHLYKVDRLADLRATVDLVIATEQSAAQNDTSAKTAQGLTRIRNARDEAQDACNNDVRALSTKREQLRMNTDRISDLKRQINELTRQDEDASRRLEELSVFAKRTDEDLERGVASLMHLLRDPALASPAAFERLSELASSMERLKLPENTSRQFFVELAEEDECVCGRPLGDPERTAIRERAENYLADDEHGVVNAIKSAVAEARHDDSVVELSSQLTTSILERRRIRIEEGRVRAQQGGETYQQLQKDLLELEMIGARLTTEERALRGSTEQSERELRDAQRKLEQATKTVQLVQFGNRLKDIVLAAEDRAVQNLKGEIVRQTNDKLGRIIKLEEIRIDDISGHLQVHGKDGVSMGQALATAYSYLASLFSDAAFELPFVVDSPAGALDLAVRREVAAMLGSGLFSQLVLLVISSERAGLATPFYGRDDALFLTVVQGDTDVATVPGIETFDQFHDTAPEPA